VAIERHVPVYSKQQLNYASLKAGQHRLSSPLCAINLPEEKNAAKKKKTLE
jgi:hypothetical protein